MDYDYVAVYKEEGFEPGIDISYSEMSKIRSRYVEIYNLWCELSNPTLEKLNEIWHSYEAMDPASECARKARDIMKMKENCSYYDWIEHWYKQISEVLNAGLRKTDKIYNDVYRPDGDIPVQCCRFKDHPNWVIYVALEKT